MKKIKKFILLAVSLVVFTTSVSAYFLIPSEVTMVYEWNEASGIIYPILKQAAVGDIYAAIMNVQSAERCRDLFEDYGYPGSVAVYNFFTGDCVFYW